MKTLELTKTEKVNYQIAHILLDMWKSNGNIIDIANAIFEANKANKLTEKENQNILLKITKDKEI